MAHNLDNLDKTGFFYELPWSDEAEYFENLEEMLAEVLAKTGQDPDQFAAEQGYESVAALYDGIRYGTGEENSAFDDADSD